MTTYFGPVEVRNWLGAEQVLTYPQPSIKLTNGVATWLHFDHLGSVRALTDAAGVKVEAAIYRPFGEQSEWLLPGNASPETKGWIGERYDADAGLQYLNARYYDPALGMFLQPDWFEVTRPGVGTNRFSYSFNDPVNKIDPGGNATISVDKDDDDEDPYVKVDADGDGDVNDDDLTEEQIAIFARDYRDFILENSGADLSGYGAKRVYGNEVEQQYLRTASQFIGYNMDGGFPEDMVIVPGNQMTPELGSSTAGRLDKVVTSKSNEVLYVIGVNLDEMDQATYASDLGSGLVLAS